ncbi:immunity repressor [Rhodococcus phage Alatin]|nr:immunity repressor [Rhodococcus phage Alatin]
MSKKHRRDSDEPKLTLAEVEALKNKGLTQSEIAKQYGVTRQYVSWIIKTYGGTKTPRQKMLEHFPWEVPVEMNPQSPYRNMSNHAEYMATGGVGMDKGELVRLRNFYQKLMEEDSVLEFDPNIPGTPGFAKLGGFALRPREEEDGDLMIRVNEYTKLTEEGKRLWKIPPVLPEI